MGRRVRTVSIEKRGDRQKLAARLEPYWQSQGEGRHVGYYKGARGGRWVARYRQPGDSGGYLKTTLGEADDHPGSTADGERVLDFRQAIEAARRWFEDQDRAGGKRVGPYTVSDALDEYMAGFKGRDRASTQNRIDVLIKPALGAIEVAKLTADRIKAWHEERANTPARLRTGKGAEQNMRKLDTPEAKRRRMSTANRDLTVLKAALNVAFANERVPRDDAWRKVKPFPKVERARLRYLSDDEARRLVNAVAAEFRPMVQAALLTGARYQELAGLRVRDVDIRAETAMLHETKGGNPRAIYLEAEGLALFRAHSHGKTGEQLVFPRPDGGRWGSSQQIRYLRRACEAANISPAASFHDLRRTFGARLAHRKVPMAVIAEALGHADERITRRHYAHISGSYVADQVREHAAGLGIVAPDAKVTGIAARRG